MRKVYQLLTFTSILLSATCGQAQDFSNKGKDFWVIYTGHIDGTTSRMALYITSDSNAVGTATVNGNVIPFTVTANQVTTIRLTNSSTPSNSVAYNGQVTGIGANKGIHIETDKPVVVYSHILNAARSGSTLVLPTNVLGREYYVASYKSVAGSGGNIRRSEFAVVASEDNTTVEITPTVTDGSSTYPPNVPFQVTLNKGDVFQYQSANDNDLTGSYVKSIATPTSPCKPIAVFAGSTWTAMGCNNASSGDNLYQQLFPLASWGREYITAPFILRSYDVFRILVKDPTTVVQVNGVTLNPSTLIANTYYDFNTSGNNTPRIITSDKPICVLQYLITQNCDGVNSDPEMIILNSIEQTLNDITVLSARNDLTPPNTNITRHFLNIIIKTSALSSLTIDGAPYTSVPVAIPSTSYSYLQEEVTASTNINPAHRIRSDSGFIAIAYGYGNVESYGYNAGTNVRDLYQFISIQNQYATVNFPAACKNSPFYFSMTFPYQPTQVIWNFNGLFPNDTLGPTPAPMYDSTWFVNGRQLFRYKLPAPYTIGTPGSYPIQVIAQNPTPDGCSGTQIIDYNLVVYDSPVASFTFTNNGCVTDSVHFFGTAGNTSGRTVINWSWNFGDAGTASIQNPAHKYNLPGTYNAKFSFITDVGCLSDTAMNIVTLNTPPTAKFGASLPQCLNQQVTFTDSSSAAIGSVIVKWYWNFGDGSPQVITTSNTAQVHTYSTTGTFIATLKVETATGCQSIVFSRNILIQPNPLANFNFSNACLPVGTAQFTDQSTVASGTVAQWSWNFGDGGISSLQNPAHNYSSTGPFNVLLKVTTNSGCVDSITKVMNTVYAQPQANFNAPAEVCHGTVVNFADQSAAANSTVTKWLWNFGDGITDTTQNPTHLYAAAGSYNVTLVVTSAIGCISNTAAKTVVVNPLPTANFTISAPICATRNITFTDASSANAGVLNKWTWDFGDGTNAVYTNGNPFIHIYSTAGIYNATLQVESSKGCISTITTKQVVVNVLPTAGFVSPEVCLTDPAAPFIDTSSVANGSIVAWNWNFGDPNANVVNPNTSTIQNPTHRYSIVGSYTATLIVTSNQGCKDTVVQTFTVNGSVPAANFTVQNASTLCSNRDVVITDASTVDFGNIIKVEIYWDYSNDPTIKTVNNIPQPGQSYNHLYPEFGTPFTKTYTVRMISYSGINCLSVITKTITVLATPSVQFNSLQSVCADEQPFLINQAFITNGLPGSGVFSGAGTSPSGIFNPALATPGIYTIRYTYTGTNSCANYKEQTIQVFPVPKVSAGPDRFMLQGGSILLLGSASGNGISYLWTPNVAIDSVTRPTPKVSPPDDIYYTLTVTSADGCKASDTVFVKVLKAPVIPNIFSPNGDGIHDKWEIAYLESYPGCTVDIFNRYGQLIYHSIGYDKPWDGTVNGKAVPVGTYYYIVDPKNGRKKVAGYVDVIR